MSQLLISLEIRLKKWTTIAILSEKQMIAVFLKNHLKILKEIQQNQKLR